MFGSKTTVLLNILATAAAPEDIPATGESRTEISTGPACFFAISALNLSRSATLQTLISDRIVKIELLLVIAVQKTSSPNAFRVPIPHRPLSTSRANLESSADTPRTGSPAFALRPCAVAMPDLNPVKLPGPVETAIAVKSREQIPADSRQF